MMGLVDYGSDDDDEVVEQKEEEKPKSTSSLFSKLPPPKSSKSNDVDKVITLLILISPNTFEYLTIIRGIHFIKIIV